MKLLHSLFLAAGMLTAAATPLAAELHVGHAKASAQDAATAMSEGTVRKIDLAAGKLTIAHGPLKNLGMPSMTMVFKAKDPAQLKDFKVGDSIRFVAEQSGNDYVVSRLQRKP